MNDRFGKPIVSPLDKLPVRLPAGAILLYGEVAMKTVADVILEPMTLAEHSAEAGVLQSIDAQVIPGWPQIPQQEHGREWPQVGVPHPSVHDSQDGRQTSPFDQRKAESIGVEN